MKRIYDITNSSYKEIYWYQKDQIFKQFLWELLTFKNWESLKVGSKIQESEKKKI